MKIADIYSDKLSEGSGRCPENLQGTDPLTQFRALPESILAGRQEKGAVVPFLLDRIIRGLMSIDFRGISSQAAVPPASVFHGSIDNRSAPVQQSRFSVYSEWSVVQGRSEAATCLACDPLPGACLPG